MKSMIVLGGLLAVMLVGFVAWNARSGERDETSAIPLAEDVLREQDIRESMVFRDDRWPGDRVNEVLLDDGGQLMEAILGSFGVVDAIESHALVEWADASFVPTTAESVTLHVLGDPTEVIASLTTSDGTALRCALQPSEVASRKYMLNLCNDHSGLEVVLTVSVWYEKGGDASYIYPLRLE